MKKLVSIRPSNFYWALGMLATLLTLNLYYLMDKDILMLLGAIFFFVYGLLLSYSKIADAVDYEEED